MSGVVQRRIFSWLKVIRRTFSRQLNHLAALYPIFLSDLIVEQYRPSCLTQFVEESTTGSAGFELIERAVMDCAEGDYPRLDSVAQRIPFNNLTVPMVIEDTHCELMEHRRLAEAGAQGRRLDHVGRSTSVPRSTALASRSDRWHDRVRWSPGD